MRSALAKIDTIEVVDTDTSARICKFNVDLDKVPDLASKLEEIGSSNQHVAGWSVATEG